MVHVTADHLGHLRAALWRLGDCTAGRDGREQIAAHALDDEDVDANRDLARHLLADELAGWVGAILAEVARLEGAGATIDSEVEGLLGLDLALVRVLETVDPEKARRAREGREGSSIDGRWALWTDLQAPRGLILFANVIWSKLVAERWRRGIDRPAALVHVLVRDHLLPLSRGASIDEHSGALLDARGERISTIGSGCDVATIDLDVMRRGLEAFRSTAARRFVRFFAHEAHRGELRGDPRPEVVTIDGGLTGLAERIGCDPAKHAGDLRDLLDLGRWLDVSSPALLVRGLWTWNYVQRTAPGQRSRLEVNLNPRVFLAGAAEAMKATGLNTRDAKRARLLVPVCRHDPPHRVPQRREWGRVWTVADAVLVLLVENGAQLDREGGVRIDAKAWARLTADAGLETTRASTVRDLMLEGDGTSPPLLVRVKGDRFTLAADHATELRFILARAASGPADK